MKMMRWLKLTAVLVVMGVCLVSCEWSPIIKQQQPTPAPSGESAEPAPTEKVYVVNPDWDAGIQTAQAVNSLNATPTAPLVNLGLGLLSTALAGVATLLNHKKKTAEVVRDTVIKAVEQVDSSDVKAAVTELAQKAGNYDLVKKVVQKVVN